MSGPFAGRSGRPTAGGWIGGLAVALAAFLTLAGIASAKTINGTSGNNLLQGTTLADTINAYAGDDRVFAHEGNDTVNGGPNFDELKGGPGDDHIYGGDGDDGFKWTSWTSGAPLPSYCGPYKDPLQYLVDVLYNYASLPNCVVDGGSGNDELSGGNSRDFLLGGPGSDYIHGDAQADVLLAAGDGSVDIVVGGDPDESKVGNQLGVGDRCVVDPGDIVSGCLRDCPAYAYGQCPPQSRAAREAAAKLGRAVLRGVSR